LVTHEHVANFQVVYANPPQGRAEQKPYAQKYRTQLAIIFEFHPGLIVSRHCHRNRSD
jgi:hypothetical protein